MNFSNEPKIYDIAYKVIIIGESRVGKTSLINRLNNEQFTENTISTVGLDFVNAYFLVESLRIKLQIWDTAGQERYHTITRNHFRNTKGVILTFDLSCKDSFDRIEYWLKHLFDMKLDSEVVYLVGNKVDLENEREVPFNKAKKLADRNSMKYFETSAKTSFNLYEIFKSLASDLLHFNDISKINIYNSKAQSFVYEYNLPNDIKINENTNRFDQKRRFNLAIKKRKKQLPKQPIIKFTAGIKPKQAIINLETETLKLQKDNKYSNCCSV